MSVTIDQMRHFVSFSFYVMFHFVSFVGHGGSSNGFL